MFQLQKLEQTVRALSQTDKHQEAIDMAQKAVAANPNNAFCHFTLSRALVAAEKSDLGLYHADRAAAIDIANPTYAYFAGRLYAEFHLYEFALPLLERSVALQPRAPKSQLELAQCYDRTLRPAKASKHYELALSLEEDLEEQEKIKLLLARSLADSNRHAEARSILEPMILAKGKNAIGAARELAFFSKDGPESPLGEFLSQKLKTKNIDSFDRSRILMALGRLHNNAKDYDRAFSCWQASREIEKLQPHGLRDHPNLIARAKSFYSRELFEKLAPKGLQTDAIAIVCGMPRSGTTLTEQIIASHSQASGAGEIARWSLLEEEFMTRHSGKDIGAYFSADQHNELRARGEEILRILQVMSGAATPRIVEKTPHSFAALGYIKLCCPKTKFIHIQRHPLDAFISTYQNQFSSSHGYAYDQVEYAREYVWHLLMMNLWKSLFPQNIFSLKYEDLARQPEVYARKIIEFIGLDWEEGCLEFYRANRAVRTFSSSQVRSPVYDSSIGRWKHYKKHLEPIMAKLSEGGIDWTKDW